MLKKTYMSNAERTYEYMYTTGKCTCIRYACVRGIQMRIYAKTKRVQGKVEGNTTLVHLGKEFTPESLDRK